MASLSAKRSALSGVAAVSPRSRRVRSGLFCPKPHPSTAPRELMRGFAQDAEMGFDPKSARSFFAIFQSVNYNNP
jgi:hypothetical protein